MTIATKLNTINSSLSDIKDAIIAKGVTPEGNITTYASAISSIASTSGGGITPSDSIVYRDYLPLNCCYETFSELTTTTTISAQGTLDVSTSLSAQNDELIEVIKIGANSYLNVYLCPTTTDTGNGDAFYNARTNAFLTKSGAIRLKYKNENSTCMNLGALTRLNINNTISLVGDAYITKFLVPNVTTIERLRLEDSVFAERIDFPKVSDIAYNQALYNAFSYNMELQELYFNSLNSNSFGNYTNQFDDMLEDVTGCTVHFPSNLQSVIGSWSSVTSGFGGTNTTVLFDLPATS